MATSSARSRPKPSSDATPNWRASSSRAIAASNSQPSRSVTSAFSAPDEGALTRASRATRSSLGASLASTASRSPASARMRRSSPVERSAAAMPHASPSRCSAHRKLFRAPSSRSSAKAAPGVIVSTTSRLTMPRASLGSSTCSQMATRKPWLTRRRRYSLTAFTGTPASGTSEAPPLLRAVRVRPSVREAISASS